MNILPGSIVKAVAGREKNSFYVAVEVHDGFVKLANGRERKLEKPKLKNAKHISPTYFSLDMNQMTNKKLRKLLSDFLTQNDEAANRNLNEDIPCEGEIILCQKKM